MAETFTPPTPTEALRLADIHLRRYQGFLDAAERGARGYRPEIPTLRPLADYLTPVPDEDEPPARFLADAAYRDRLSVAMSEDDAERASLARVAPLGDEFDVPPRR